MDFPYPAENYRELLNSKINERIKTDKRTHTYNDDGDDDDDENGYGNGNIVQNSIQRPTKWGPYRRPTHANWIACEWNELQRRACHVIQHLPYTDRRPVSFNLHEAGKIGTVEFRTIFFWIGSKNERKKTREIKLQRRTTHNIWKSNDLCVCAFLSFIFFLFGGFLSIWFSLLLCVHDKCQNGKTDSTLSRAFTFLLTDVYVSFLFSFFSFRWSLNDCATFHSSSHLSLTPNIWCDSGWSIFSCMNGFSAAVPFWCLRKGDSSIDSLNNVLNWKKKSRGQHQITMQWMNGWMNEWINDEKSIKNEILHKHTFLVKSLSKALELSVYLFKTTPFRAST